MSWSHFRRESIPHDARYLLRRYSSGASGRNSSEWSSGIGESSGVGMVLVLGGARVLDVSRREDE